jgi:hypothetical protein
LGGQRSHNGKAELDQGRRTTKEYPFCIRVKIGKKKWEQVSTLFSRDGKKYKPDLQNRLSNSR